MTNCFNQGLNSYQKWKIGADIRNILLADETIVGYVGNNIYPLVIPENVDGDCIVYNRMHYSKKSVKMGVYEDECSVAITILSDNYDRAVDIAQAVDIALIGQHRLGEAKITIDLADSNETFEDFKYIEVLMFNIK
jgi:hypothetical protein